MGKVEMVDIVNEVNEDGEDRREVSGENKAAAALDAVFAAGEEEMKEDRVYGVTPRPNNGAAPSGQVGVDNGQIGPAVPVKVAGTFVPANAKVAKDKGSGDGKVGEVESEKVVDAVGEEGEIVEEEDK